jgi:hypothetical protein
MAVGTEMTSCVYEILSSVTPCTEGTVNEINALKPPDAGNVKVAFDTELNVS